MKLAFLTFGGGNENYHGAVHRICNQAFQFGMFNYIYGFTEHELVKDKEWWEKHSSFILANKRGFGYWIWKCYLIKKVMEKLDDGDIAFYTDCGCELNIQGFKRLIEYIDLVIEHDTLAMKMGGIAEKRHTKMDLALALQSPKEHMDDAQIESGIIFMKKTQKNMDILDEIIKLYEQDNYHLVDDSPSVAQNDESYQEHRHDQSILSLVFKKHGCFTIQDETYFGRDWSQGINQPILAFRNRSGFSYLRSM